MDYQNVCFFSKEPGREIYCEHEQLKVLLFDLCTHSILYTSQSFLKKKSSSEFYVIYSSSRKWNKKKVETDLNCKSLSNGLNSFFLFLSEANQHQSLLENYAN